MRRSKKKDCYDKMVERVSWPRPVGAVQVPGKAARGGVSAMDWRKQHVAWTSASTVEKPALNAWREHGAAQRLSRSAVVGSNVRECRIAERVPWRSPAEEWSRARMPGERIQYNQESQRGFNGRVPSPIASRKRLSPEVKSCYGDAAQHFIQPVHVFLPVKSSQEGNACGRAVPCIACGQWGHGCVTCPVLWGTTGDTGGQEFEPASLSHKANVGAVAQSNACGGSMEPAGRKITVPVSVDSTSILVSEVADIPAHSCSSEDLCSLEVQSSLRSADFSPYSTIRTAATGSSCASLEHSLRCGLHLTNSPCSPDDDGSRASTDRSQKPDCDSYTQSRSLDSSTENFSTQERESQLSAKERKVSHIPIKMCCGVFSQPPGQSLPSPGTLPVNPTPHSGRLEKAIQQHHARKYRIASIVRSTSDPISCTSSTEAPCSYPYMTASACQETGNHFLLGKQKDTKRGSHRIKPKALKNLSKERPNSLVDLKTYKDTKILVAKFLEHSNCHLSPEVQHVVNSIKSVIKSDERHMEEAIFSANIIDQVITSSQQNISMSRKRLQEDLHLRSCGALSSPVAFLHRIHLARDMDQGRPHSLIGVCRETIL